VGDGRLALPAVLLGMGLGGFVDGIVLHQSLQWHHLLSAEGSFPTDTLGGLEDNTVADGAFHAATLVMTVVALVLLSRIPDWHRRSPRILWGLVLVGWGTFNLVEGVVDHHLLTLHHVREGAAHQDAHDIGFLVLGAVLVGVGMVVAGRRSTSDRRGDVPIGAPLDASATDTKEGAW
jgi:uncharacterized membrane protein